MLKVKRLLVDCERLQIVIAKILRKPNRKIVSIVPKRLTYEFCLIGVPDYLVTKYTIFYSIESVPLT